MANYYQPEIETMPYNQLRELQNERFMKQIRHVWDNVPYQRGSPSTIRGTCRFIRSIIRSATTST